MYGLRRFRSEREECTVISGEYRVFRVRRFPIIRVFTREFSIPHERYTLDF